MTVSSETNKVTYAGDGATTVFSTSFLFSANNEVSVVLVSSAGVETAWTEGTQYTLTGAGTGAAGSVTVDTSPTDYTPVSGQTLVVRLTPAFLQQTALPRGGVISPVDIEATFDNLVRQNLRQNEIFDRTVTAPITEASLDNLPLLATRANKLFAFTAGGQPTASTKTLTQIESGADDAATSATAAAASATSAATSATSAATSATNAAASATSASSSAAAAAASAASGFFRDVVDITYANSPYTISNANDGDLFEVDTSGGNVIVKLPNLSSESSDQRYAIAKLTSDANTVTVQAQGSGTINGAASHVITDQYDVKNFIGDQDDNQWLMTIFTPATGLAQNKYDATSAPTAGDDTNDGYSVGSVWVDVTADRFYICVDASAGAAVWASRLELSAENVYTAQQRMTLQTDTSSSNAVTFDFAGGDCFLDLTENITSITISNLPENAWATLIIQQGSGARTVTGWPAAVKWPAATAPTISTTDNAYDVISLYKKGSDIIAAITQDHR